MNKKDIAEEIGVSPSTVSRELKRNSRWNYVYSPEQAAASYNLRRKNSRKPKKFTDEIRDLIKEKLKLEWSPEQISGYGKRHNFLKLVMNESINMFWRIKPAVVNYICI